MYSSKIVWFWSFPRGGFANSSFQFLFAKYTERILGCKIILGGYDFEPNLLWDMFSLPDQRPTLSKLKIPTTADHLFLGKNRSSSPRHDIEKIKLIFENNLSDIVLVDGYFQYDTNFIKSEPEYFSVFNTYLSKKFENTQFQKEIKFYKHRIDELKNDNYLITCHIRRGDYLNPLPNNLDKEIFYTLKLDSLMHDLYEYIEVNRIKNPLIYIATDDKIFCKNYFLDKKIRFILSEDIYSQKDLSDLNRLIIDITFLASSQMLIASNSSLSILASLLNDKGSVFWRQKSNGITISFDPWSTPILLGLETEVLF